jgi:hypothetical protein
MPPTPLHPDVPQDRAWQDGRRLYVRCGYKSQLNAALRELGATWDPGQHALWTGSGKREQVTAAVLAAEERIRAAKAVKALGLWVAIPPAADDIRGRAKELCAVFDGELKQWAMPSEDALTEVLDLIGQRQARIKAENAAAQEQTPEQGQRERAEARVAPAGTAQRRIEQVIAKTGRTPTGETATATVVSTRRMNKATAASIAEPAGAVIHLADGRRGLITGVDIWFTNDEMASSVCWHPETHDEAHWDFRYEVAIVEPTPAETAEDEAAAAYRRDAQEIHDLMDNAGKLTGARAGDHWTPVPDREQEGSIYATAGTTAYHAGTLILTTDGQVIWQHPGWYDDYIRSEGITTSTELVTRVRAVLAGGDRRRVHRAGPQPIGYEVRTRRAGDPS